MCPIYTISYSHLQTQNLNINKGETGRTHLHGSYTCWRCFSVVTDVYIKAVVLKQRFLAMATKMFLKYCMFFQKGNAERFSGQGMINCGTRSSVRLPIIKRYTPKKLISLDSINHIDEFVVIPTSLKSGSAYFKFSNDQL